MDGKIDLQARQDIEQLFAQYCHRVDHGDSEGWASLFVADGVFEVDSAMRLQGTEQLRSMPGVVQTHGSGKWRHQITSLVIEPGQSADTAKVQAYGLVTDWREGGKLVTFTDYQITLRREAGNWRIVTLFAKSP